MYVANLNPVPPRLQALFFISYLKVYIRIIIVLMIIINILYSGLGGHSSVVFPFVEADEKKQYRHILIFYGIENMPQSYIDKCRELSIPFFFVKKEQGLDMASQKKIIGILKEVMPDIILLHSVNLILPVYLHAITKGIRIISIEHQSNKLKSKKDWIWSRMVMLLSRKVVYLTDLYAEQMKDHLGLFYADKKVRVINNGINTTLFSSANKLNNENNSIGMLARLSPTKEHITLVEAFKMLLDKNPGLHNLRLKIAGDGEMKETIQQKVKSLGISGSVDFLGMLPEHLCAVFLNELTIYVHVSLGETMSTSLMQAMACGKPIIASDVDGINNMITHGETGILVPVKNMEELANAMEKLLQDANMRDRLGRNAVEYARRHFTSQAMFIKYEQLFI